jgi:ubiquinone biosynthesis protein COQ4
MTLSNTSGTNPNPLMAPTSGPITRKRDYRRALSALRKLLKDKEDTAQVFEIMIALTGSSAWDGYMRFISTVEGGKTAYRRENMAEILSDHDALARLPAGSVGRAYLDFVTAENISAEGLIAENRKVTQSYADAEHPVAWYGRRLRDTHDLWHVLTGYGRDALGEACLVAFSYAQTKSLGFGLIAFAGAIKIGRLVPNYPVARAVFAAYLAGRDAAWLPAEDYPSLLAEPLIEARIRLKLAAPKVYQSVPVEWRNGVLANA